MYAPHAYGSYDADFILERDEPLADIDDALGPIGFKRDGKSRMFVRPDTKYTIDFPRGPLAVGGDYVHETATLTSGDKPCEFCLPPIACAIV